MKKILLPLFLIATSMGTIRLSAYCFYNWSKSTPITVVIHANKIESQYFHIIAVSKAFYKLSPGGGKACRNWKNIDKTDRKKEWYWHATNIHGYKLGSGYFPIGGVVVFAGYDENDRAKFKINYDGKPWKYWESPWKHESLPWETSKRKRFYF